MNKEDVLSFPLCVFPKEIQQIIEDTHRDLNFPVNYIAASLFFAVSLAIGTTRRLSAKKGWNTKCIMFMSLLGQPGAVKTHPIVFALAPFAELDKGTLLKYEQELEEYRKSPIEKRTAKPKARQFIVKDITIEGLAKVQKDNPHGICVLSDELKGWVANFNRYRKSGGDQEQWLSLYNGGSIVSNRKSQDDIVFLPESFVNVIGGLQPGVLANLFKGEMTENGFLYRILFVNNSSEDEPVLWSDDDLPSDAEAIWRNFILKILSICGYYEPKPTLELHFSGEAWSFIKDWQNNKEIELINNGSDAAIAIFRKIQEYALRFCIVIHTIREAYEDITDPSTVDVKTVILATVLADYFFATAKDVYAYIIEGGKNPVKFFELLNRLNTEFTTKQALIVGGQMGLSTRTIFRYLDVTPDDPFLKKLKHGHYEKKD